MNRGVGHATVHAVSRVRHDLATTPPPPPGMIQTYAVCVGMIYNNKNYKISCFKELKT